MTCYLTRGNVINFGNYTRLDKRNLAVLPCVLLRHEITSLLMSAHRAEYCAHASAPPQFSQGDDMADQAALAEIERRIRIVEDNLRELMEQAAAYSGAADEERNADRIADQQAKLDALMKDRETLLR
jgi:hypothetical protein